MCEVTKIVREGDKARLILECGKEADTVDWDDEESLSFLHAEFDCCDE